MNLEKLDADERERCFDVGKTLAPVCLGGFDDNKKFLEILSRLSPQTRRILVNQIILYRICFVYLKCRQRLDEARAESLLDGLRENLRGRLSPTTSDRLKNKLRLGTEIPFDKFTVRQLAQQAGFSSEDFTESEWERLQEAFSAEFEALNFLVDGFIKMLNTPRSELKNFTLTVPVKQTSRKTPSTEQTARPAQNVRKTIPVNRSVQPARKETSWGKWLTIAAVVLTALFLFGYDGSRDASPSQNPPAQNVSETVAKIGVITGYVYDHPILNDGGLCEFTVDNTRNDMPVYVRIWDVDAQVPVRAFNIAQGDKFTAENLSPGTYEVRYMYLYENDVPPYGNKSEPTTLEQYETYDGTRYSTVSLTLYKVHGGNTTTTRINVYDV
ncbi:MAG: hypothetical protein IJ774_03170 [Selenomonadaceae bacterium]|nr:hypothetical protein [Selenomonadaceae bacterium]